jgi:eukaryotic-like serine/threonine-protein kinase
MDAARWEKVRSIFQDVFERDPAERTPLLDTACGDDVELRRSVERLLAAHRQAAGFLEEPAVLDLDASADVAGGPPAAAPTRIGRYRVLRELGHGGMGTVYLAERDEPGLRQAVAVKVVRPGMDSDFILRRFQTERQILAGLEHPGIARLYDGGTTEDGRPYFVMEYVDGRQLLEYCDGRRLGIAERVQIFRRVCQAVQFAHQSLVVHRDLKPSNVLVTAEGDPKLLDFGIAKLLTPQPASDAEEETATAVRLLSPQYASPEQFRGEPVTTASDVYSLGVILCELLSGHRPYRFTTRSILDIERTVRETEPLAPSVLAARADGAVAEPGGATPAAVSASRGLDPRRLERRLRGDLDNVVLKALSKAPGDRYQTAAELAEDLRRHLEGFPVRARANRPAYRAAKFVRRHRAALAAAAAVVISLITGLGVAIGQARVARRERDRAGRRFEEVRRLANVFLFDVHDRIRDLPGSTPARELVVKTGLEYMDRLAGEAGDDPALLREVAAGYSRLGDVQGGLLTPNLGQSRPALDSHQRALDLLSRLLKAHPDDAAALRERARARLKIALVLLRLSRIKDAQAQSGEALADFERCAPAFAASPEFARERGDALVAHGYYTAVTGDIEGGLGWIRRGVAVLEPLHAAQPKDPIVARSYGLSLNRLSQVLEELPDGRGLQEAMAASGRAISLARDLLAARPTDTSLRRGLSGALGGVATLFAAAGRHEEALAHYGEARGLYEEDVRVDASDMLARRNLSATRSRMAKSLNALGRAAEARDAVEPALVDLEAMLASDPQNLQLKLSVGEAETRLGQALKALGGDGGPPGSAARGLLTAARTHFQRAVARLDPLVKGGLLVGTDAAVLSEAQSGLDACEKALAARPGD